MGRAGLVRQEREEVFPSRRPVEPVVPTEKVMAWIKIIPAQS